MTRQSVILKAINKHIRWGDAADILGISPRQMRRIRAEWEEGGWEALMDHRNGRFVKTKILADDTREICRLKQDVYPDLDFVDQTFGVSYQGKLLGTYSVQGEILSNLKKKKTAKKKSKKTKKEAA